MLKNSLFIAIFAVIAMGCTHTKPTAEHKALWEHHKDVCFAPIYARHMVSRSKRGFGPVFQGKDSFVVQDHAVVGLRYHVAFYWSAEELTQLQKHFTPWFIVTYDLEEDAWSVESNHEAKAPNKPPENTSQ